MTDVTQETVDTQTEGGWEDYVAVAADVDADQAPEMVMVDTDQDQAAEAILVDTDNDNILDTAYVDSDNDNAIDAQTSLDPEASAGPDEATYEEDYPHPVEEE